MMQGETALRTILNMIKECNCAYLFRINREGIRSVCHQMSDREKLGTRFANRNSWPVEVGDHSGEKIEFLANSINHPSGLSTPTAFVHRSMEDIRSGRSNHEDQGKRRRQISRPSRILSAAAPPLPSSTALFSVARRARKGRHSFRSP